MADAARNTTTGRVMQAAALRRGVGNAAGPWQCRACGAAMAAVGRGAGRFRVSPHFRANERHARDCDADGNERSTASRNVRVAVRNRSTAGEGPSALRLPALRRQRPRAGQSVEAEDHEDLHVKRDRGEAAPGTHGRTVSTLRPVSEHYSFHPEKRGEPLTIPGCPRATYGGLFGKLSGTTGYARWPRKVLFAPIRFKGAWIGNDTFVVYLHRVIWSSRRDGEERQPLRYYRITMTAREWSEGTRGLCRDEWREAVQLQSGNYRQRRRRTVYAFFLGEQERGDLSNFVVRDHRLVCFLNLRETEVANL